MKEKALFSLPPAVAAALGKLEAAGFEAWCVGGCVRDSLLGKTPYDWDIATGALPQETAACFRGERLLHVGEIHGTIALVLEKGRPIEITTFRRETGYSDRRHPDAVVFCHQVEEDLARRDFTINAMAYHPHRGLADPFGGQRDLKAGVLRCVGAPRRRLEEDALRILRCLRFAAQLGFSIEPETAAALLEKKTLLSLISPERVREELTKLLCGKYAPQVLREHSPVAFTVLPELAPLKGCTQETPYHCYDVWEHTLHALGHAPQDPALRWAALLHDGGKPRKKTFSPDGTAHFYGHPPESGKIAREVLGRLRFSKREIQWIGALVDHHEDPLPMGEPQLKKLLGQYGEAFVRALFSLQEADMSAKAPGIFQRRLPDLEKSRRLAEEILRRGDCLTLRDLALKGADLAALGVPPGPEMGALLGRLLETVLQGGAPNERETLSSLVRSWREDPAACGKP